MRRTGRWLRLGAIATLIVVSLMLIPANPVLARSSVFFGLNVGVPLGPYPVYPYPYAAPVYYPPAPAYGVYPPCARVWVPGYYDAYGNWVFGYYRYECGPPGY